MTASRPLSSHDVFGSGYEEPRSVFEDMITEEYILRTCGADSVDELTHISLVVDTSYQSLLDLGDIVKNLTHLTLDHSQITCVRDLGTGLRGLTYLSLNSCCLNELDGIGMLVNLVQLSVRDNMISDITALAMHETLKTLDLHGNRLSDISIGDTLSSCPELNHLVLSGNPIERAPKYSLVIASMIPQLTTLDGVDVDVRAKNKVSNGMILEAASAMLLEQEELDDERRMEMAIMGDDFLQVDCTSSQSPATGDVSTAPPGIIPDTGSDLTHGTGMALAGGMAAAMRRRRLPSGGSRGESPQHDTTDTSALSTLDSVLSNRSGDLSDWTKSSSQFYKEGDITSQVMARAPHASSSPKLKNKISANSVPSKSLASASFEGEVFGSRDSGDEGGGGLHLRGSHGRRTPSPRRGLPPTSPQLQRNASRPHTTCSRPHSSASTCSNSSVGGIAAPSAPFKVLLSSLSGNEQALSDLTQRIGSARTQSRESTRSDRSESSGNPREKQKPRIEKEADIGIGMALGKKPSASLWDVSDDSSEDEGYSRQRRHRKPAAGVAVTASTEGKFSSIVHRNSVLRGKLFDDESPQDEEELAVDHESRRKMCSDNMVTNKTSSSGFKFFSSTAPLPSSLPSAVPDTEKAAINDCGASPQPTKRGKMLSDMAGRSLGFDLKGSLAAINQWVEEMDSDDDEEDDTGRSTTVALSGQGEPSVSFRIAESSNVCLGKSPSQSKILSRDKILNMCTRADETSSVASIPENIDPSPVDNYSAMFGDYSVTAADSSEAYEENEVAFFDNNVEKCIPATTTTRKSNIGGNSTTAKKQKSSDSPLIKQGPNKSCDIPVADVINKDRDRNDSKVPSKKDRTGENSRSRTPSSSNVETGAGVDLTDEALITMLSQPPKSVPLLRTKTGFQEFFRGMGAERMRHLLYEAYSSMNDLEREVKVKKRMELLNGVLLANDDS
eukprot:CAMPEP_0185030398 /NCGR_PEP_ID=MMETSP1103-20130426/17327_1 /TAXON_ID=36769 /ORGANISM="Paraphysomonas bandaiensis, Strain Caron Lab Isolate" /LENGTH=953 /DNA_ID=CAMNT_0027565509 /DNA_START=149 /DNA_END=3013 /DNA_ORIENTATION=-